MIKIKHIALLLNEEKLQEDAHLTVFLYFTTFYSVLNLIATYLIVGDVNFLFNLSGSIFFLTLLIAKNKKLIASKYIILIFELVLIYTLLIGYIITPLLEDGLMFIIVFPIVVVFLNTSIKNIISLLFVYYLLFILINIFEISNNSINIFSLLQIVTLQTLITISIKVYIRVSKLKDRLLSIRQNKLQNSKDRLKKANLETLKLNKILEELSSTDELTKINNRRTILKQLNSRMKLYKRKDTSFAVVLVDIDHFKKVNDTYGHQKGDEVLIEVSTELEKLIRDIDHLGRYGGEEFLILIECNDKDKIIIALERLILGISTNVKCNSKDITISAGATIINKNDTQESVIHRADEALYEAKKSGRNKFIYSI